jgi:hypothetical protein
MTDLKFAPPLQFELDQARWRRAQYAAARLMIGLFFVCVIGSYIYGALAGGA